MTQKKMKINRKNFKMGKNKIWIKVGKLDLFLMFIAIGIALAVVVFSLFAGHFIKGLFIFIVFFLFLFDKRIILFFNGNYFCTLRNFEGLRRIEYGRVYKVEFEKLKYETVDLLNIYWKKGDKIKRGQFNINSHKELVDVLNFLRLRIKEQAIKEDTFPEKVRKENCEWYYTI